jgi:Uma2 family endonuclease
VAQTKPAGSWTYEDLFSLSDDSRRYEIIEGELYEMPPPGSAHALVIAALIRLHASGREFGRTVVHCADRCLLSRG